MTPDPKSRTLDRPRKPYRRTVASRKQWEVISAEKIGPCRVCGAVAENGKLYGLIHLHHLVARSDGGDDVADNIVPLCPHDHDAITRRDKGTALVMLMTLTDAEYSYAIHRGGEDYFDRCYGVTYAR